jgi:hypothetical protein
VTGVITTIAGNSEIGPTGDDGPATLARLDFPGPVEALTDGSLVFTEPFRLRRIRADGIITTLADASCDGFCPPFPRGDFPVGDSQLDIGMPSALPGGGFLYGNPSQNRVGRFGPDGTQSTVATIEDPYQVTAEPGGGFTVFSRDARATASCCDAPRTGR